MHKLYSSKLREIDKLRISHGSRKKGYISHDESFEVLGGWAALGYGTIDVLPNPILGVSVNHCPH